MKNLQHDFGHSAEHKKLIAHGTILVVLISVALWDATRILSDYIYNNRYTLVKLLPVNDEFLFLENETMKICLHYESGSVFQETWWTNNIPSTAYVNSAVKKLINRTNTFNATIANLTYDDRLALSYMFSFVRTMDLQKVACSTNPSCLDMEAYFLSQSKLGSFLTNKSCIDKQLDDLWKNVQPSIIRPARNQGVSLLYMDQNAICADVRLSALRQNNQQNLAFLVGTVINTEIMAEAMTLLGNLTVKPTVQLSFTDNISSPSIKITAAKATSIYINVGNIGVYDRSNTETCTNEPTLKLSINPANGGYVDECVSRKYLEIFAEKCKCVPFTYRDQFRMIYNNADYKSLPYCSPQMYKQCNTTEIRSIIDNAPCTTIPSCVSVKNYYTLLTTISDGDIECLDFLTDDNQGLTCANAIIKLQCKDSSYTIYEERFQLNAAQLLSQVGGNVGLYTGISILGIWQFMAFIFSLFHGRRKARVSSIGERLAAETSVTVLQQLVRYMEGASDLTRVSNAAQDQGQDKGQDKDKDKESKAVEGQRQDKGKDKASNAAESQELESFGSATFETKNKEYEIKFERVERSLAEVNMEIKNLSEIIRQIVDQKRATPLSTKSNLQDVTVYDY